MSIEGSGRRWLCVVALVSMSLASIESGAAEMKARVAALKGEVVVLEVERGHFPRVGDRVEISTRIGGETFPVGRWRVSKVSGRTVEAVEVDASAPASVGMTARITAAPAPPARAAATPPPPAATAAAPSERPPPPPAQRRGRREIPASAPLPWRQPKPPAPRAGRRELPPSEPLPWRRAEPAPSPPPPAARRSGPSGSEPPPWRRPRAAPPPHAVDPAPAAIASRTTRRYRLIWKDSGSGADEDFATFRPVPVDGFYPLGDRAVASPWPGVRYATPIDPAILVRPGAVDLARPVNYRLIWSSAGSWSDTPFSSWQPIPPRGYTCLGDVGSRSLAQKPSTDAIRCVPDRCVRAASLLDEIWKDRGSGADDDFSAWRIPGGLYVGNREHARPDRRVYALDAACLAEP